jgi:transcription termination factor Rho
VSVLQRKELENSPLADLHAIASELGIEGYRALRQADLIAAILKVQGGADDDSNGAAADQPADEPRPRSRSRSRRPSRRRSESQGEVEDSAGAELAADEPEVEERKAEKPKPEKARKGEKSAAEASAPSDDELETLTGVLDVLPNASGFLRREDGADVYVSPAQIRRCELRAGDEVSGPVRPPRRNERHPSLVRVSTVNGRDPEGSEERPDFNALTAAHPSERLAVPAALAATPIGKGSRVAIAGPSGAGATRLLRELIASLGSAGALSVSVVLVGARPEELADWRADAGVPVSGGSFDEEPESLAQAAQLEVERAKRIAERGGDAVVAIDSLEALEAPVARRLFGAARNLQDGGSLTIVAAVGDRSDLLRLASTRIVLAGGGGEPTVVEDRSGTQRADLLD